MQIQAKNVTMEFNDAGKTVSVLRDVSLVVPSGTSMAIVGESGIGKTTLLSLLGGLERPVSGEIQVGDNSLSELRNLAGFRGRNIGFIFQAHHLLPEFDARENTAMPLLIRGTSRPEALRSADEMLERVQLGHRLTHRPGALSGGEQQRVAIARALCGKPGVVLADEPTGNLDHRTGKDICELLLTLQREQKMTLVIVTHSMEIASMMDGILELTPGGLIVRNGNSKGEIAR